MTLQKLTTYYEFIRSLLIFRNESKDFKCQLSAHFKARILKNFLPHFISNLIKTTNTKPTIATEWKRFIAINLIGCIVENYECTSLLAESVFNEKVTVRELIDVKILTKAEFVKLEKNLPNEIVNDILENYSIYNGQYFTQLWVIYDFLIGDIRANKCRLSDEDFKLLLGRFSDTLDLISPHCLAKFIKCARNFFLATTRDSLMIVVDVFQG